MSGNEHVFTWNSRFGRVPVDIVGSDTNANNGKRIVRIRLIEANRFYAAGYETWTAEMNVR